MVKELIINGIKAADYEVDNERGILFLNTSKFFQPIEDSVIKTIIHIEGCTVKGVAKLNL